MGHRLTSQPKHQHKAPDKTSSTPHVPDTLSIEYLQRTLGNQATIKLLQRHKLSIAGESVSQTSDTHNTLQRGKQRKAKNRRRKRKGKGKRQHNPQSRQAPTPEPETKQTWADWFWSWAPSYETDQDEDEGVEIEDDPNLEVEGDIAQFEEEFGEEPEDEDEGFKNPFAIEQLEIDLGEGDFSSDGTMLGDVKGKGKSSLGGDGTVKLGGKVTTEGAYGSGEAEGKLERGTDTFTGEGKAGFLLGASKETKFGSLGWRTASDGGLVGSGKMENKVGLSSELAAKIAANLEKGDVEASGKLGAFFGATTETTVDIKLKANGKDLTTTEGKIGLSYGVGGEISGFIKWEGGELTFGNAGKLSAGLGFSYGYSVKIDTNALFSTATTTTTSTLGKLWSWMWG